MDTDTINVVFQDAVFEKGYIWFFDNVIQALCRINTDGFVVDIISCFKGENEFIARKIFLFCDKFYMVTDNSVEVLIFDRKNQETDLAFFLEKSLTDNKSYRAFFHRQSIYFFPRYIDEEVICFDVIAKKYLKKPLFKNFIKKEVENERLLSRYPSYYEGSVWFVLNDTQQYVRCDLDNERVELFQIHGSNAMLDSCYFDGEKVWLTELGSDRIICEGKQILQMPGKGPYSKIYPVNEGIIFLQKNGEKLFFVKNDFREITVVKLPLTEREKQLVIVDWFCEYGTNVFFVLRNIGSIFVFDKINLIIERSNLKCTDYIKKCFGRERILLKEDEQINIKVLLQFYEQNRGVLYAQRKEKIITSGEVVWKAVC